MSARMNIFAVGDRVGDAYLWLPLEETPDGSGRYFVMNGTLSKKSLGLLEWDGFSDAFVENTPEIFWVTLTKQKRLEDEVRDKLAGGYQNFGPVLADQVGRIELLDAHGLHPLPLLGNSLAAVYSRGHKQARFSVPRVSLTELRTSDFPDPVWA